MARELCVLADVTSYAPGYVTDATTDALLNRLITAESRTWHEDTGREFSAIAPAVNTRRFDLGSYREESRKVRIGDASTVSTVKIIAADQTTEVATVSSANYVLLERVREEWQPITALWFPPSSPSPATFVWDNVLEVTGTWGFPAIPADVKEGVAAMVIFRYMNDVTTAGTRFAEALAELNLGALFAGAQAAKRNYLPVQLA